MQFSKPMIELVLEIRRRVPSELKPEIKLANPELFDKLNDFYHSKPNAISKALIKELFTLAGPPWTALLTEPSAAPKSAVNVYRGSVSHQPKSSSTSGDQPNPPKAKRIYRGQVVG